MSHSTIAFSQLCVLWENSNLCTMGKLTKTIGLVKSITSNNRNILPRSLSTATNNLLFNFNRDLYIIYVELTKATMTIDSFTWKPVELCCRKSYYKRYSRVRAHRNFTVSMSYKEVIKNNSNDPQEFLLFSGGFCVC